MVRHLWIAIGTALLAAPAAAQTSVSPPSQQIDPAGMEAARALLRGSDFEAQMEEGSRHGVSATFDTIISAAEARRGEPMPSDLKDRVKLILLEASDEMVASMKQTALDDAALVYARYFTADELRELLRLQDNPVMVKFRKVGPAFTAELMQIGVAAAARQMPELQARVQAEIDQWVLEETNRRSPPRS
jgi:hypothetical protein